MFQPSMPAHWTDPEPRATHEEPRELSIVRDISQTLAERPDLKAALRQALQTLATQSAVGIQGAMVVVPGERAGQGDPDDRGRHRGAAPAERRRSGRRQHHRPGPAERASGRHAAGHADARPGCRRRERPPRANCRSSRRRSCSVGAPSARSSIEYAFDRDRDLHRALSYVTLLASTLSQAVGASRRATERQRLSDETSELRNKALEQAEFPQARRHLRAARRGADAGGAGGLVRYHGAAARRVGHRQGAHRPGDPPQFAARAEAVRHRELRRAAGRPRSSRSSSATKRGAFTGAQGTKKGRLRDGQRRHAVPRRGGRAHARRAGEAAARPAGARVRAAGRHPDASR